MQREGNGGKAAIWQPVRNKDELCAQKKAGVTFKSYPVKRKCWVHPFDDHILAAAELADWLELQPFVRCKKSEVVTGGNWREMVAERTGILCFEDYYAPSAGSGGDHIDLRNKDKMTGFGSGLRASFGIVIPFGIWSDLRKAKKYDFFQSKDEASTFLCVRYCRRFGFGLEWIANLGCI